MTTTIGKGADLMEVLKKKMRQAKEDTERLKDDNEEISRKLQIEVQRREAVSQAASALMPHTHTQEHIFPPFSSLLLPQYAAVGRNTRTHTLTDANTLLASDQIHTAFDLSLFSILLFIVSYFLV